MLRYTVVTLAMLGLAACGEQGAEPAAKAGANGDNAAEAADSPSEPAASVAYSAGQNLIVLKEANCRGLGADADDEPWEMTKGAFVKFVAIEGSDLRVENGPGMECLIAPDAVGPA